MRFLLQRDALARARPPLRAFLVFAALLVAATLAQREVQGGLTPAGLEAAFADAAQAPGGVLASMAVWEQVHADAFLYGFLLLTLGSLLAACRVVSWLRSGLLVAAVTSALGDMLLPFGAGWLPGWSALRAASFGVLNGVLVLTIVAVWIALARVQRARGDA